MNKHTESIEETGGTEEGPGEREMKGWKGFVMRKLSWKDPGKAL